MNKLRSINKIMPAMKVNMGGIMLDQALPLRNLDKVDPFLLVHHLNEQYPKGSDYRTEGVPPHPHRGFAPVSVIFKGELHHRDSLNMSSIVAEGGTQWMHAGRGIVHSERPSKRISEEGAQMEFIQFWVNAPAAYKMNEPHYHPLSAEETPWIFSEDKKVKVGLIAGEFMNKKGNIKTYSPLLTLRFDFEEGGKMTVPFPKSYNAFIYLLDGKLTINGERDAKAKEMVLFENDGEAVTFEACENTRALLLAGEPINEPVATYGPFVMNEQSEILQAMRDYQMGKMGTLVEKFD